VNDMEPMEIDLPPPYYEHKDCAWRAMAYLLNKSVEVFASEWENSTKRKLTYPLPALPLTEIQNMVEHYNGQISMVTDPKSSLDGAVADLGRSMGTKKVAIAYLRRNGPDHVAGHVVISEQIREPSDPKDRLEWENPKPLDQQGKPRWVIFDYQPPTNDPSLKWIAKKGINTKLDSGEMFWIFAIPPVEGDIRAHVGIKPPRKALQDAKRNARRHEKDIARREKRQDEHMKRRGLGKTWPAKSSKI
jgi:hypothetical protein